MTSMLKWMNNDLTVTRLVIIVVSIYSTKDREGSPTKLPVPLVHQDILSWNIILS